MRNNLIKCFKGQLISSNWEPHLQKHKKSLSKEKVYYRILKKPTNSGGYKHFINIGLVITDILNIKGKDRIQVFFNQSDRHLIMLKKSLNYEGISIGQALKSNVMNFAYVTDIFLPNFEETTPIAFEIYPDHSLILDLKQVL